MTDGKPFLAMIATRGGTRWGLPKGALNAGETAEQAAVREVNEETNLEAEIVATLESIEYWFRVSDGTIQKRVDFYLMRYLAGDLRPQLEEVDAVEWVPLADATTRASFDSERKVIEDVKNRWEELFALESHNASAASTAV